MGPKRRNVGLGSYPEISLAKARERAKEIKEEANKGVDPIHAKSQRLEIQAKEARLAKTFEECSNEYMASQLEAFQNLKHRSQWRNTLETYAFPNLGKKTVSEIDVQDVVTVLRPIWLEKTETAKRLMGRIEKVLDYAIVIGSREKANPARWKGLLETQLPKPSKVAKVEHHPSLPYQHLPQMLQDLSHVKGVSALALRFLILTAVRSGTVREAKWTDIKWDTKMWEVREETTKTRKPHRVPLCDDLLNELQALPRFENCDLIFPSSRFTPLSDMSLTATLRRLDPETRYEHKAVPHGFRSTFKVWAVEATEYPTECSSICLMHKVGDDVYRAYQRSDLFEKRRAIMRDWYHFATSLTANGGQS
jgi:integrase